MRARALALAAVLLAAGCGGSSGQKPSVSSSGVPALSAILDRPGPDVALTPGTADYAPGPVRMSFLVVRGDGKPVYRPRARVWVARALDDPPLTTATAVLEPVGVEGSADPFGVTHLYVARFSVPGPGTYAVVVEPVGGSRIQAYGDIRVKRRTASPPVGSKAFPSRTPTIASTGGNFALLTTRTPPDRELLRHSIAGSLAARKPFVVTFATPKFCTSRTCGPVVDVVEAVRRRFARSDVRFIHVEIFERNDPARGPNRWVKEWKLPSEPWTFLVGRDGRIKAKFEGSVSAAELTAAVRRHLARS